MTPHDKLCTAISIVQAHILSMDSNDNPEAIWGTMYMPTPALEMAVKLLSDIVDDVPDALPVSQAGRG